MSLLGRILCRRHLETAGCPIYDVMVSSETRHSLCVFNPDEFCVCVCSCLQVSSSSSVVLSERMKSLEAVTKQKVRRKSKKRRDDKEKEEEAQRSSAEDIDEASPRPALPHRPHSAKEESGDTDNSSGKTHAAYEARFGPKKQQRRQTA